MNLQAIAQVEIPGKGWRDYARERMNDYCETREAAERYAPGMARTLAYQTGRNSRIVIQDWDDNDYRYTSEATSA